MEDSDDSVTTDSTNLTSPGSTFPSDPNGLGSGNPGGFPDDLMGPALTGALPVGPAPVDGAPPLGPRPLTSGPPDGPVPLTGGGPPTDN